ncbi:tyrosine-type recombinase/integrase [Gordonia sp. NPDC003504]
MSKRSNGEGTVRQRPDGRWEGRLSYIDPVTETRKRVSVYAATATACRSKLKDVVDRIEDGQPAKDAALTLGQWLKTWRTTALEASDRRATTKALYSSMSRTHLEGSPIGRKRLDKLKPSDVEAMVVNLRKDGLSESTVRQVYTVLRAALDIAVRDGLLGTNPAAKVRRPKVTRAEARHLSTDEVRRLLDAARSSRYFLGVLVMATTGLRRGEVAGLAWSDVDLDKGELTVRHTLSRVGGELVLTEPKTTRSRRRVPLLPNVVAELRTHRTKQKTERLAAGDQWVQTGMVFTTEFGTMVDPRNMLRVVEVAAKAAKLEDVGAHTLRHSAAVALLEGGVNIKAVADILGHSSVAITGDVYGHTTDDSARAAIATLGSALGQ